jgi:hypothetical protein
MYMFDCYVHSKYLISHGSFPIFCAELLVNKSENFKLC